MYAIKINSSTPEIDLIVEFKFVLFISLERVDIMPPIRKVNGHIPVARMVPLGWS